VLLRTLIPALLLSTGALADTITLKSGNSFEGQIINITDQSVFFKVGRETSEFRRTAVDAITFSKSDLVVLTSRDTLLGKVLRTDDNKYIIALDGELRSVPASSVVEILPCIGKPVRLRELASTNEAFHIEQVSVEASGSSVFFSVNAGLQKVSYSFPGDEFVGPAAFDKSFSGIPYSFEIGVDINPSVSATIGVCHFYAETDIPEGAGQIQPFEAGYSSLFASGILYLGPRKSLDIFFRIRLAIEMPKSTFYQGKRNLVFVPGVGAEYALSTFLHFYGELDWHFSSLKLLERGDAIDTQGPAILAGVQVYLPKIGF
jgi:hypothetical protein